ncbi:hypothetical protein AUP07_0916 [methanogenic archaeon mixed culture ISO4-G1]|nr:hypothetical protein AUP07_0916 [methanogenic archaeon mixed culture ISO4-G1]
MYNPSDMMHAKTLTEKHCGRCGHDWISSIDTPARCPHCGTYHWQGESTVYMCCMCGHSWFSRTPKTPMRCPKCKTRSWQNGSRRFNPKSVNTEDKDVRAVIDMYLHGKGCVAIAMSTGMALSNVIDIVKITVSDGRQPRM